MGRICLFTSASAKVYGLMDSMTMIIRRVLPSYAIIAIGREEFCRNHRGVVDACKPIPRLLVELFERFERRGLQLLARAFIYVLTHLYVALKVLRCRCDVLFVINADALIPMLLARLAGIHVVLRLGGSFYETYRKVKGELFARSLRVLERALTIVAHKVVYAGPPRKLSDKYYVANEHPASKEFLEAFKFTSNAADRPLVVGYLGRLSMEKGVDVLAEAVKIMVSRDEELRILIAGDGPLRGWIEDKLRLEIECGRVKLLGWLPHESTPSFLSGVRLLLMPSYTEGLPAVLVEAMACGTPVVASPVGEIPSVLVNGETGLLIDKLTPARVASLALSLVRDEPRLRRMSVNSFKRFKEMFDEEKVLSIWRECLSPPCR